MLSFDKTYKIPPSLESDMSGESHIFLFVCLFVIRVLYMMDLKKKMGASGDSKIVAREKHAYQLLAKQQQTWLLMHKGEYCMHT